MISEKGMNPLDMRADCTKSMSGSWMDKPHVTCSFHPLLYRHGRLGFSDAKGSNDQAYYYSPRKKFIPCAYGHPWIAKPC